MWEMDEKSLEQQSVVIRWADRMTNSTAGASQIWHFLVST